MASPHCASCARYIADRFDEKLYALFSAKQRRRLATTFQPLATKEITRLLMLYIAEEKHYEETREKIQNFVNFTGVEPTIHMFCSGIPAVSEALEAIDVALFDVSGKGWDTKCEWIRGVIFYLFLDLLEIHRMHQGRAPFRDVWSEAAREKRAAASAIDYDEELQMIKIMEPPSGVAFLESYLNGDDTQKKEWAELYC
jgi:hypothetical protein